MKITDISSAKQAMQKLHDMGAKTVIISSSSLGTEDVLVGLGSCVKSK
jgi:pyridoxine kinase